MSGNSAKPASAIDFEIDWIDAIRDLRSIRTVRLAALIAFIVMLPSIAFGRASGWDVLCISSDHVSYNCHDQSATTDCGDESDKSQIEETSTCLDVATAAADAPMATSSQTLPLLLFTFAFTITLFDVASQVAVPMRETVDEPPAFCARSYCCSIALRC